MKLIVTADLHYNIARSRGPVRQVAGEILSEAGAGPATLVLLGDIAGANLTPFIDCLSLFADFPGRKLIVPGNHCLWCRPQEDSIRRYRRVLPVAAAKGGFDVLDHGPVVLDDVALVGSIGWYDYSFRDTDLGIPLEFYQAKVSPRAAEVLGGHDQLLARHRAKLSDRSRSIAVRWMDGKHVKLPVTDEQFLDQLTESLSNQLAEVTTRVDRIIAMFHHLPFAELVPQDRPDRLAFAAAYLGSSRLGEVLLGFEKVTHVFCGHSHWPQRLKIGHIEAINVGSTYKEKRFEILEV